MKKQMTEEGEEKGKAERLIKCFALSINRGKGEVIGKVGIKIYWRKEGGTCHLLNPFNSTISTRGEGKRGKEEDKEERGQLVFYKGGGKAREEPQLLSPHFPICKTGKREGEKLVNGRVYKARERGRRKEAVARHASIQSFLLFYGVYEGGKEKTVKGEEEGRDRLY